LGNICIEIGDIENAFKNFDMIRSNWSRGSLLKWRIEEIIGKHNLQNVLHLNGYPCLFSLTCRNSGGVIDDSFRTLMMQEMISRGVLFQGLFYTTWSHQSSEIDHIVMAFDEACLVYKKAIVEKCVNSLLIGQVVKPVFRKLI
jgi:glutamate-1-semialdehyde 2,1-aminomutase